MREAQAIANAVDHIIEALAARGVEASWDRPNFIGINYDEDLGTYEATIEIPSLTELTAAKIAEIAETVAALLQKEK